MLHVDQFHGSVCRPIVAWPEDRLNQPPIDPHLGSERVALANLILNVGPVNVTVVLVICAAVLLGDGNSKGTKFLKLGVYSGIWNLFWSGAQLLVRSTLRTEEEYGHLDSPTVLFMYVAALLICIVLTALFAHFMIRVM